MHLKASPQPCWYFYDDTSEPCELPPFVQKIPFSKSKNCLGQGVNCIIFDARHAFHLDSFAIAAGTLKQGGVLLLLTPEWENWATSIDNDSRRWADGKLCSAANFIDFLQKQLTPFPHFALPAQTSAWQAYANHIFPLKIPAYAKAEDPLCLTADQQNLLEKILSTKNAGSEFSAKKFIITAKRGRGKSALAGRLVEQLLQAGERVFVTAPNKNALASVQAFCTVPLPFIAPDALLAQGVSDETAWLFIDEGAMLPLPLLQALQARFENVVITTTIDSYEGTGRGFLLKFMAKMPHYQAFTLEKPLRWAENDPLEKLVDRLLLLENKDTPPCENRSQAPIQFAAKTRAELLNDNQLTDFYQLLSLAHYRTTPVDLRRLFDAPAQRFFIATQNKRLVGGIWALEEGGLPLDLIAKIIQGERRPAGNLAAQMLAQALHFPPMASLKSLRISRIAIEPSLQQQGLGSELLQNACERWRKRGDVDFISVSFGYTAELADFWQKNGFCWAFVSQQKTASSGAYSVMALLPLTAKGREVCQRAIAIFQHSWALSSHSLAPTARVLRPQDWQLSDKEWAMLQDFAFAHRAWGLTESALRRLLACVETPATIAPTLHATLQGEPLALSHKVWLKTCRAECAALLRLGRNFCKNSSVG